MADSAREAVEDAVIQAKEAVPDVKSSLSGIKSFVSGGFGGICCVLVGHPFDLIKVRMQTAEKGVYSGTMDVVRKTLAKAGPTGLYAGVSAPLIGVTPMFAISFLGYDMGKGLVSRFSTVDAKTGLSTTQIALAGLFSAIPCTLVTAPFERVKVLLQVQGDSKKYNGSLDVMKQLYKTGGIKSVYRGSLATFARDGPGSAAYFASYEVIKRKLTPRKEDGSPGELSVPAVVVAGGMAGVAMWTLVFPVDTIKSTLQATEGSTVGQVIRTIHSRGGIKAFFPGIGPALLRSFPANAATFLGVEVANQFMTKTLGI
ncbi:mitochondrial carnitine/acylcarnitine carrier protein [Protomyces lactucae-debilis]|uniref:Mitochondrial carnitine/acylcarnitine carrier protein n=1 Tax=Protomyces lactucae-debilis TaxID=2754530 RepID=A0A1Y2FNG7_PROLT|nr:mitochondrial carnitine/acylcarnitine carrier protein [Protomyces lactucae-debilis]ORY85469.1 mitochondrial carnitine/acylcarnitine carrier protein [Protomyces lactucae-debilis]